MNKPTLIAEIGQEHNGSLLHALELVDTFGPLVDIVKFQIHLPEVEEAIDAEWRVPVRGFKNRYEYWQRTGFNPADWIIIANRVLEKSARFMASVFSFDGLALYQNILDSIGQTHVYKVASGEIDRFPYKHCRKDSTIYISTGLGDRPKSELTLHLNPIYLKCVSAYPTLPRFTPNEFLPGEGWSDHSGSKNSVLYALANGAEAVEFHVKMSNQSRTPDSVVALTPAEVADIASFAQYTMHAPTPMPPPDNKTKRLFKDRAYAYRRDMQPGERVTENNVYEVRGCPEDAATFGWKLGVHVRKGQYVRTTHLET